MAAWVYIWALIVTIVAVAEFGSGFFARLFGFEYTPLVGLVLTSVLLLSPWYQLHRHQDPRRASPRSASPPSSPASCCSGCTC